MTEPRCPQCKKTIDHGQNFCGNCRTQIVWRKGVPGLAVGQTIGRVGGAITTIVYGGLALILIGWLLWTIVF